MYSIKYSFSLFSCIARTSPAHILIFSNLPLSLLSYSLLISFQTHEKCALIENEFFSPALLITLAKAAQFFMSRVLENERERLERERKGKN